MIAKTYLAFIYYTKLYLPLSVGFMFALLWWCIVAIQNVYLHPLSYVPGPRLWIISRLPYVWRLYSGRYAIRVSELHRKYGPVVRVASNEVSFIDEQAWTSIYASHQGTQFPKSPHWYRERPEGSGCFGIMSSPHAEHGRMRRIFAPAFTEKAVREREPLVLRHTNFLMDRLAQEAAKASPVNIKDWFHYTTFDLIGEFELSESFDCLRSDRNHYLIDTIQNAMKTLTRVVVPRILGLESIWPWIFPSLSMQKRKPTERRLSYWTHQRLKEGDVNNKNDLMSLVCRSHSENNLLLPEIENSLSDFMIAGSETIATTLTSIFYFLVRDPEIHRQVSNEVRNSFPREADITTDSVAELSLLNAVIKEAMRLCPSLPMVLPRITTEPGATVCGYWLPPGTYVSFCQLAAYSSRLNFASPERFVPRRWLPDSKLSPHNARVFQPFSVGPRNCIGKGLGLAAVRTIVAKTLWNFDVARGEEDWEWTSQKSFFVWEKRPLYVGISQVNH